MGGSKIEYLWLDPIRGMSGWGPALHGNVELMKSAQALTTGNTVGQELAQNATLLILPSHLLQVHCRVRERGIQFGVRPSFLMNLLSRSPTLKV